RASLRDRSDVVGLHSAIYLEPHRAATGIDAPAHFGELGQSTRNELLSAKPRIHRHDQHQVELVQRVIQVVQRRGRIEYQAGLASLLVNQRDRTVDVVAGLGVETDDGCARLGEVRNDAIDGLDHQVHVDGRLHTMLAQGLAHQGADGEIRHIVVVHDVEVDDVRASGKYRVHILTQPGEVRGQDGWRYPGCIHDRTVSWASSIMR